MSMSLMSLSKDSFREICFAEDSIKNLIYLSVEDNPRLKVHTSHDRLVCFLHIYDIPHLTCIRKYSVAKLTYLL